MASQAGTAEATSLPWVKVTPPSPRQQTEVPKVMAAAITSTIGKEAGFQAKEAAPCDHQYGGDVRPSYKEMYKVLVRKTFQVNRRQYRLQSSLAMPLMHASVNLALWIVLDNVLSGEWKNLIMLYIFRFFTPMCMIMSMKVMINSIVLELVAEKESKMMVVQLIAGVPSWLYWAAYGSYYAIIALISSVVWTIMVCCSSFDGVNPLLVFFMFLLSYLHCFGTSVMWATVLNTKEQAQNISGLILMTSLLPVFSMALPIENLPGVVAYVTGLLPNFSLVFWANSVVTLKLVGTEWSWDDSFMEVPDSKLLGGDQNFGIKELPPAGALFLLFFWQTLVWCALSYWLNQVWRAEHGVAKHPCFCLRRRARYGPPASIGIGVRDPLENPPETADAWSAPALQISHLSKTFLRGGRGCLCLRRGAEVQRAVDDLTLDVQKGELFALLGHNGAGKTTAINCVSGMLPPTSGEVQIMGIDLATNPVACQWNLSVCPQDNPFYDNLSVDEHLRFFSSLRGASEKQADEESAEALEALGLTEKRSSRCSKLSGGQKRRLWVATALMGKSPLVFLDEPSSGMDPSSRRELWKLLLSMKARGRSILFTTHYLEEADVLASRKAVLAKGKVQAIGTSKELKMQFGTGYHLRALLAASAPTLCKESLANLVKTQVAGSAELEVAEVERAVAADAPTEVVFTLPFKEFDSFGPLFVNMEQRSEELQILDFELGMTSLEEVFMALGKETDSANSDAQLEFQQLEQEADAAENVALSRFDYAKVLFRLRTRQMRTGKIGFTGITMPLILIVYGTATSTGFFTHNNMMSGTYAIFPAFLVSLAGMRLLYTVMEEREQKIRHVMISQGLPAGVYWLATALHCAAQMAFLGLVSIIPLVAMNQQNVIDGGRVLFIAIGALLLPLSVSLYFYLWSYVFTSVESALKVVGFVNVLIAMFVNMVPNMLWNMTQEPGDIDSVAKLFHNVLSFVDPFYSLPGTILGCWRAGGLQASEAAPEEMQKGLADGCNSDCGLGRYAGSWEIWAPIVGGVIQSAVLMGIIYWLHRAPGDKRTTVPEDALTAMQEDADVLQEKKRVQGAPPDSEACMYRDLHHTFFDKERTVHAVRGISLGIKRGECFGLLGPNGAGKTTTLGCLTGEILPPTKGEVYVAGHSVTAEGIAKAYEHLGNCPQIDPIFPLLPGRWQLEFYGRMKGVPASKVAETADGLLQRLGIEKADRDKEAKTYSGGMKRKLSLAIAFIGRSDVLFLDEPSAGVDASAKRLLWQAIKMRAPRKTVIITTHSMEEAEATCDRIAIQVSGQLRCLGSSLHLKSKYGSGYQLEIRLPKQPDTADVPTRQQSRGLQCTSLTDFLQRSLSPEVQLLEAHEDCYVYQLPSCQNGGLSLGQIFTRLQNAKQEQGIEEYSLSQPSLEQVFLRFAREQKESHV